MMGRMPRTLPTSTSPRAVSNSSSTFPRLFKVPFILSSPLAATPFSCPRIPFSLVRRPAVTCRGNAAHKKDCFLFLRDLPSLRLDVAIPRSPSLRHQCRSLAFCGYRSGDPCFHFFPFRSAFQGTLEDSIPRASCFRWPWASSPFPIAFFPVQILGIFRRILLSTSSRKCPPSFLARPATPCSYFVPFQLLRTRVAPRPLRIACPLHHPCAPAFPLLESRQKRFYFSRLYCPAFGLPGRLASNYGEGSDAFFPSLFWMTSSACPFNSSFLPNFSAGIDPDGSICI